MKGRGLRALGFLLIASLIATGFAAAKVESGGGGSHTLAASGCQLNSVGGKIKHVVYLQFDNTHYTRDNPTVASDLGQMPHLLNFLKSSGTLFTNDHTVLISHTAGGILSTLTGLYPDRHGVTVSNSYAYFPPSKIPAFSSAFKYWTDLVDDSTGLNDGLPNMFGDNQANTPAPWVPFTRAGCDVGGVSLANIELENTGTAPFGGMSEAFATNTLGYLAHMHEAGVPITYGYTSDAHENQTSAFPAPFNPNFPRASGPGEADSVTSLASYDRAFQMFFDRLAAHGIDKSNTLFVVTVDEGDKYAGGIGIPQSDGTLGYSHANCSWTTTPACPPNQIGEVN